MPNKRRCKACKEYAIPRGTDPRVKWCSDPCKDKVIAAALEKARETQRKQARRAQNQEKRARKLNDLPHQKTLTRLAFNKMIRLLDAGQLCISCGKEVCGSRFEAGHFKSVGSHPELRYDPRNCYLQGSGCNQATSSRRRSNLTVSKEYEQRLRDKMGDELVDWLNGPHEPKHYTCDDLRELRAVFNEEVRRLERGEGPSRDWRKLPEVGDKQRSEAA